MMGMSRWVFYVSNSNESEQSIWMRRVCHAMHSLYYIKNPNTHMPSKRESEHRKLEDSITQFINYHVRSSDQASIKPQNEKHILVVGKRMPTRNEVYDTKTYEYALMFPFHFAKDKLFITASVN